GDSVERHPRGPADRAYWLDHQLRHFQTTSRATHHQSMAHRLDELSRRGRIVVVRVRDAQAPARPQLPRLETQLVPQLDQQPQHDLHRLLVSAQPEDLRPDVRVQADEVEARVFQGGLDRFPRGARLDRETELGVELP